jgi:recombination protein RecA
MATPASTKTTNSLNQVKEEKEKALSLALTQIEREFGKGAIMKLGDGKQLMPIESISTGILPLDIAIGVGGVPKGRVIEIFGPESSGKTTLTLSIIANSQKNGGIAAFIDAEHALDPLYAKKLGVNINELLISQPDDGEQALEIAETLVRSGAIDVVVIDSVAALVPRAEIEGSMDDMQVGLQARLMSKGLRKLTATVSKSKTCIIFINQLREKIGVMYGNPETTTGGRALKFYSSVRIDIRKLAALKKGEVIIGNRVKVKIVKNKVAPPFRQTEFDMFFDRGIIREACILEAGTECGIINRTGTWYLYNDIRLGQGRDKARVYLEENPKVADEIEKLVLEKGQFSPDANLISDLEEKEDKE